MNTDETPDDNEDETEYKGHVHFWVDAGEYQVCAECGTMLYPDGECYD